jgi:hypothetical protein
MGMCRGHIAMRLALVAGFCAAARAQSVTEYGSMASKSSTVGRRANNISNEIGGVWSSLDRTIKSQDRGSSRETSLDRTVQRSAVQSRRRKTWGTGKAAAIHEDPSGIKPGLGYEELIRRFGPASFEVSTGPRTKTLAYAGKEGDIDIELLDGKVTKVAPAKAQEVAVVQPR